MHWYVNVAAESIIAVPLILFNKRLKFNPSDTACIALLTFNLYILFYITYKTLYLKNFIRMTSLRAHAKIIYYCYKFCYLCY